jgi:peptidoglycan hydrolase FlgJ
MDGTANLPPALMAQAIASAPPGATGAAADPASVRQTAENFEGFFLSQVFESMFSGIGADSMFGAGNSETIYRSLLLQEYSKVAVKSGGIGIADAVQREILRARGLQ